MAATAAFSSCRATVPNRSPLGERFPSVQGKSLDGQPCELPGDLEGELAVLILGYVQKAQFDADRWLFGLLQAGTPARVLEVPTIPGLMPSWFGSRIDAGMRSGIPSEDWGSVVTIYGDPGERIVAFTGNERPRNVRVVLLDREGRVRWFHDRGFSAGTLLDLDRLARELRAR
jgi:hypothetical protein